MEGIAAAEARIREITTRLAAISRPAGGRLGEAAGAPGGATASEFAAALEQATAANEPVPASSGGLNKAGVDPVQWARDFLTRLGMPITSENIRAVEAWQQAEGTAARFNPLATTQAGFAGETRFNSVGVKNYATYRDGIEANAKAITNGLYGNILDALRKGTSAEDVARAITNSPWGSGALVERILASQ
jgi:hypothetical protein